MANNRPIKKLGDICIFQNGFAFKSNLFREVGEPILRISNIQNNGFSDKRLVFFNPKDYDNNLYDYIVNPGDLVIAMSGATTGKLAINNTNKKYYLNQRVGKFTFDDNITKRRCHLFLTTKIESNLQQSAGSAIPNLSTEQIKSIELPVPSLDVQKDIVTKIDKIFSSIDDSIALTQANITQVDEMNKSLLDKIFEAEEAERKKIGDKNIITLIMGQSPSSDTYNKEGIGLPFFQGKKEFGKVNPIPEQYCSKPLKIAEPGDILMSVRAPVGPTNLADQKCCIGRGLGAIRPNKERLSISYLLYFLKKFEKNISSLGKGSTFDAITKSDLENVEIPVPTIPVQEEIVKYLDKVFTHAKELKHEHETKLTKLKELKASILQSAFEGKLI